MAPKKAEIEQAVSKKAKENQISCKTALNLANALGVSPATIGKACNALGIKIRNCQLGCF